MKPYNVEIFNSELEYVCNTTIGDDVKYKYDILDPEKFTVDFLPGVVVELNYYIRIWSDDEVLLGVVSEIKDKDSGIKQVTIKDIAGIFDVDIMVDIEERTGTLEQYVADRISETYISNTDTYMNIPATITTTTETESWMLEMESEDEELTTLAEVNLFDDIVLPAFQDYDVVVNIELNIVTRQFEIKVGKNTAAAITVESDLPNIISKDVTIQKIKSEVNKLFVYNTDTWTDLKTYYLHSDGTWDTTDSDRLTPVNYKIEHASESTIRDDSTDPPTETVITFETNADAEAEKIFSKNKYKNYIALEVFNDDDLLKAYDWKIGQVVNIISDGVSYQSIYSGREVNKTTKLIFGKIRIQFTKIIKGRA